MSREKKPGVISFKIGKSLGSTLKPRDSVDVVAFDSCVERNERKKYIRVIEDTDEKPISILDHTQNISSDKGLSTPASYDIKKYGLQVRQEKRISNGHNGNTPPLLLRNHLSKTNEKLSEEECYRRDISCRPLSNTLEEYDEVPVECFGVSMLEGMGWNKDDPGITNFYTPEIRPERLGLGADRMKP